MFFRKRKISKMKSELLDSIQNAIYNSKRIPRVRENLENIERTIDDPNLNIDKSQYQNIKRNLNEMSDKLTKSHEQLLLIKCKNILKILNCEMVDAKEEKKIQEHLSIKADVIDKEKSLYDEYEKINNIIFELQEEIEANKKLQKKFLGKNEVEWKNLELKIRKQEKELRSYKEKANTNAQQINVINAAHDDLNRAENLEDLAKVIDDSAKATEQSESVVDAIDIENTRLKAEERTRVSRKIKTKQQQINSTIDENFSDDDFLEEDDLSSKYQMELQEKVAEDIFNEELTKSKTTKATKSK